MEQRCQRCNYNYTAYDAATGSITEQISDVATGTSTDYSGTAPWSTASGYGANQVTYYQVDNLGRTVEQTDPDGNITWVVINDADNSVRVFPGWSSSTHQTTGPVQVYRQDWALGYDETLTISTPSTSGWDYDTATGAPLGDEPIADMNLLSLSRTIMNNAGQEIEEDGYFSFTGMTYSESSVYPGTVNTNYYATKFAYNADGLLDKTVSPSGTIYRSVYNGLGWLTSTWVGTDDTPTTGYWSPTNLAGTNMVETEEDVYDGCPTSRNECHNLS